VTLPDPPAPGETREILPGLRWVRLPLPFPPRHVNVWLIRDDGGWLVVDAGARTEEAVALWQRLFGTALDGRPVTRVLATHFHPDHVGLAGWLCQRWGAPLLMPRIEWLQARLLRLDTGEDMVAQQVAFARRNGCPEEYCSYLAGRGPLYVRSVGPVPRDHLRIAAGEALRIGGRDWRVLTGSGHAPEMAMLHAADPGVLIAADQVLPRISPYVGVHASEPEEDPLGEFLASNAGLLDVPDEVLVLPSHGEPFRGLHGRIAALAAHHAERLDVLREACRARPLTGFGAAQVLFPRDLDHRQLGFAVGETLAHLNRLLRGGELRREEGAPGVPVYRAG